MKRRLLYLVVSLMFVLGILLVLLNRAACGAVIPEVELTGDINPQTLDPLNEIESLADYAYSTVANQVNAIAYTNVVLLHTEYECRLAACGLTFAEVILSSSRIGCFSVEPDRDVGQTMLTYFQFDLEEHRFNVDSEQTVQHSLPEWAGKTIPANPNDVLELVLSRESDTLTNLQEPYRVLVSLNRDYWYVGFSSDPSGNTRPDMEFQVDLPVTTVTIIQSLNSS
ncbi:MAG: hypothetical protein L6Q98_21300 [Anaerolineae bacterium]|nr:hypothetical protein [Anaerolineae bacterium]NUQ06125.1 hypothetical protein [Anaerolineae bacterium]